MPNGGNGSLTIQESKEWQDEFLNSTADSILGKICLFRDKAKIIDVSPLLYYVSIHNQPLRDWTLRPSYRYVGVDEWLVARDIDPREYTEEDIMIFLMEISHEE